MTRRKQQSTTALLMEVFLDGPLTAAEAALEVAQALVARRQTQPQTLIIHHTAKRSRKATPQVVLTERLELPKDGSAAVVRASTGPAAVKPVVTRRRRVAAAVAGVGNPSAIAPRRRGRPARVPVPVAAASTEQDVPLPIVELPEQVSPDDYEVVE